MQHLLAIACACAVIAVAKGGVMDKQTPAGGESSEEAPSCPSSSALVDMTVNCALDPVLGESMQNYTSKEEYRQAFRQYCQQLPVRRQCMSQVLSTSQKCYNQTQYQVHQVFSGMCESALNVSCADDGAPLATIFHTYNGDDSLEHFFVQCMDMVDLTLKKEEQRNQVLDRAAKILTYYRRLNDLKECLLPSAKDNEEVKTTIVAVFDGIRQGFQCIHPELGTLVLCSEIDLD